MSLPNLLSLNFLMPFVAHKLDFSRSIRGLRGMPRRLLLVGHKLDAGTPTITTLPEAPWVAVTPAAASPGSLPIGEIATVSTESDAVARFGEGSMLMQMWRAAKANAALGLPIDVIAVAPNGSAGVASTTLVFSVGGGTVQAAGEVMVYIEGQRVSFGVTTVDTAATSATKLIAAINAATTLPVVAEPTGSPAAVKLTCRWGGLTGNQIDVRTAYYADDILPKGLTLTIPAMSGGTTSPDLSAVIAAMADYRATEIVLPFTDSTSMSLVEIDVAARWQFNNMRDSQVVTALRGTEAEITAWLAGRNSDQVHTIATTKDMTSPWATAAMAGAAIESSASIDPALPYTDIVLVGYKGPKRGDHWTIDQANNLLLAGGSPLSIAQDATGTLLRVVTNYTLNTVGAPDTSKRELAWIKTMSYYRWFTVTEYQLKYRGFKLAEYITDPIPGQKIMTKELVEEIEIGIYTELSKVALVQNIEHYKDTLVVEIDGPNGKVKVQDEPVLVVQHYQTEITSYPIAGHV